MHKGSSKRGRVALWALLLVTLAVFVAVRGKSLKDFIQAKYLSDIIEVVKRFPFTEENSLKEWKEKVLKGKVIYEIERGGDLSYVRAMSKKAASALYYKIALDIRKRPVISWRWRVDEFPKKSRPENIADKEEEDFAARVYVIFPAAFFTKSKVIEYIWSESLPKDEAGASGYTDNIKILVLQTGVESDWRYEKRDIYEDYVRLFGEEPKLNIGAVAFMTDADSTKTSAVALYDEIEMGYANTEE
ncbi:MAG: DUF3047 domain-containing protein [Candidatus Omnitrophota bacterium]